MDAKPILQSELSLEQRASAAKTLPGMQPTSGPDWITIDDAYSEQLAEKARLLKVTCNSVLQTRPEASEAMQEVLKEVLSLLSRRDDFSIEVGNVLRPDGKLIEIDQHAPFLTLSQLIQEDLCVLQKQNNEHVLTAALLCFPASWTLAEKIGKPLSAIHNPVEEYDANIAKRVQRLFDGVRVGQPMWRANYLNYSDPALFHPRTEAEPRTNDHKSGTYQRSERQTVWRLPKTDAVVFAIHTTVAQPENEKAPAIAEASQIFWDNT